MLRLKAHAKINLSLKILGKRPDGFHEIESVMQSVSLSDIITLTEIPSGIQLATTNLRLPSDSRNLAYKAAELFFRKLKVESPSTSLGASRKWKVGGVKIFLKKNIPLAAGLAGGSADAAAVLYGLNKLSTVDRRLSTVELMKLGEEIGSDVPFCLMGGNCTVKGRGDAVKRNMLYSTRDYILVVPEVEVPTKWAYEAWDASQMTNDPLDFARGQMSNEGIRNHLEPVVIKKYPIIQKVKEKLLSLGCTFVQMSGSGPSVFGIAPSGEKIVEEIKKEYPRSYVVRSVRQGIEEINT